MVLDFGCVYHMCPHTTSFQQMSLLILMLSLWPTIPNAILFGLVQYRSVPMTVLSRL